MSPESINVQTAEPAELHVFLMRVLKKLFVKQSPGGFNKLEYDETTNQITCYDKEGGVHRITITQIN